MPGAGSGVILLRWALRVLAVETAAIAGLLVYLIYVDLTAPAESLSGAIGVTLYLAVLAALLAFLTWSLWRRRRWARGPAVVLNLLLLPIGYSLVAGGSAWIGLPVIVAGLAGAGLLVAPATRAELQSR